MAPAPITKKVTITLSPRESAVLAELEKNPGATYRDLAAAAGCSTGQIRAIWQRLADWELCAPPASSRKREALAGFAEGWDRLAALMGNPAV